MIYTNSYDLRQRLIRSTVESEQTFFTYDDAWLLKKTTFPDSSALNYTYDNAHRLREISNSLGDKVAYMLDDNGNHTNEDMFDRSGTSQNLSHVNSMRLTVYNKEPENNKYEK